MICKFLTKLTIRLGHCIVMWYDNAYRNIRCRGNKGDQTTCHFQQVVHLYTCNSELCTKVQFPSPFQQIGNTFKASKHKFKTLKQHEVIPIQISEWFYWHFFEKLKENHMCSFYFKSVQATYKCTNFSRMHNICRSKRKL